MKNHLRRRTSISTPPRPTCSTPRNRAGEPIGERIVVDEARPDGDGLLVYYQLVEKKGQRGRRDIHQATSTRPRWIELHRHGPLPHRRSRCYRFTTIKPGPYPWRNHRNAWRRTSTSRCSARSSPERMGLKMYFPGDPLFPLDPIYQSVIYPLARERLVWTVPPLTRPERCTATAWTSCFTGPDHTLGEARPVALPATPGQTVGPFFGYALPFPNDNALLPLRRRAAGHASRRRTRLARGLVPDAILVGRPMPTETLSRSRPAAGCG